MFKTLKTFLAIAVSFSIVTISSAFADGHMAAIKKWSNGEFSLSTLSAKEREKELEWFHNAAKPFKGMSIKVLSETCLLYTSPSPRDRTRSRMPSSA